MRLRYFLLMAALPLTLAACKSTTSASVSTTVDPDLSRALLTDLNAATTFLGSNLPSSSSAQYDGYIVIIDFSGSSDAIGQLSASVDFSNDTYTMTTDNWLEQFATTENEITGSLTGSGTVTTDSFSGEAGIAGNLAGQVDGTTVNVDLTGTFTGGTSGTPTGIVGGETGGTHTVSFGLAN